MKRTLFFLLIILSTLPFASEAQVGINIITPDSSAILHLESTDRGFLLPRMTTVQRNAINKPATGLMVYNTSDSTVQYWNGVCWLSVWQENCNDCHIKFALSAIADTIDRTIKDSSAVTAMVSQVAGTPNQTAINVLGFLPAGMTYTVNPNPINNPGSSQIVFKVTPFTPAGTYPIVIQALCGPSVKNIIYTITIEPCYLLDVVNNTTNYSVSTDLYATYPTAPTNSPVCVVSTVHNGVFVTSPNTNNPAVTTGSLPAGSVVAIVNNGHIIGMGGDGGLAYDPTANPPMTGAGFDGGDAIFLTIDATVLNNGYIFGGGGGGNSMAFQVGMNVGPVFLGMLIGSGGGGGAGLGQGGNLSAPAIGLFFYSPGTDGTGGLFGVPGSGGYLNFPINFGLGPVQITLNPNVSGGNGGNYGAPGTQGVFQLSISAFMVINIPFVGPVTIPILQNINIPIPVPPPAAGNGGNAIKRNGNQTNIQDNAYNTAFIKGTVGN